VPLALNSPATRPTGRGRVRFRLRRDGGRRGADGSPRRRGR